MAALAEFHKSGAKEPFYGIVRLPPREETAKRLIYQTVSQGPAHRKPSANSQRKTQPSGAD